MSKYAILIYDDQANYVNATPEAWRAVVDAHVKFRQQVSELGGSLVGGEALAPPSTATTITGGSKVTNGPFVEARKSFNGYYVIEARNPAHATEIARLCPAPGGGVEVRLIVDPSTNPF